MIRDIAYATFDALGGNALLRARRPGAPVLCYHDVRATDSTSGDPGLHLPLDQFVAQMQWLAAHTDVVPLTELLGRQRQGRSLKGLAVVTFDDGYTGVLEHALPVLARLQLPCTIFVTGRAPAQPRPFWWDWPALASIATDPAHRDRLLVEWQGDGERIAAAMALESTHEPADCLPADWTALRHVRSSMVEIGAHTMTHRNLVTLSDSELRDELVDSADAIEAGVGVRPRTLAYPYGLWDARVAAALDAAGFEAGLTLDARDVVAGDAPRALPRTNIPAAITTPAFAAWVSGLSDLRAQRASHG
ncbi:MAG: polysaccharide deacetylase family protein [Gemmatimonadaceae bacterium]|nr:polysaccharide deacetylase family protein [Gemmatimonadaceae bacterium]